MKKSLICFLCLVGAGLSGQGIQYGQEFRVNTHTVGEQTFPCVTALLNGIFAVCWESWEQEGLRSGLFGQIFDESGEKKNAEFQINTDISGDRMTSCLAPLAGGGFIVCWNRWYEYGFHDGVIGQYGVFGQMFDESGNKKSSEFQVNDYDYYELDESPSVTAFAGGGFIVCSNDWYHGEPYGPEDGSSNVYGQMYDESGQRKNGDFLVNTYLNDFQGNPSAASSAGGGFVVCWQSFLQDGSGYGVYGQIFDESGEKKGGEFKVNSCVLYEQKKPTIAALTGGGFVVCWESWGQDGEGYGIYGQVFDGSGEKAGGEFQVSTYSSSDQKGERVAALTTGGFVVCWDSWGQDGSGWGVFAQMFDESGKKKNGEFRVNTHSPNDQWESSVAALNGGGFIVCWASGGQDGSGWGVYSKRYPSSPVRHILKPFVLTSPANDVTLKTTAPQLFWRQATDQLFCYPWEVHYRVHLDDNPDFSSPEIKELDQDTTVMMAHLTPGKTFFWKVVAGNVAGDSLWSSNTNAFFVSNDASGVQEEKFRPTGPFIIYPNYPNPFNPETSIRFDLPQPGFVEISVYDVSGRLVRVLVNESHTAGNYSVKWDGKDSSGISMPSGIYVCRMEARSNDGRRFTQSVKMGLVR